ncbi:MAG TPA: TlpA disulfide reductase family protein [Polyangia bacterium]
MNVVFSLSLAVVFGLAPVVAAAGANAAKSAKTADVVDAADVAQPATTAKPVKTDRLLGTRPPEWQATLWLNSRPLTLRALRGQVVLVRWWTAGGCPFCAASAPALRELNDKFGKRGLTVVGMYHHKGAGPFDPADYRASAETYGFTFPVAFDSAWRTLHSWLGGVDTGWTSVTFILDKRGFIRFVHPGGQYVKGDTAYQEIHSVVERLLKE